MYSRAHDAWLMSFPPPPLPIRAPALRFSFCREPCGNLLSLSGQNRPHVSTFPSTPTPTHTYIHPHRHTCTHTRTHSRGQSALRTSSPSPHAPPHRARIHSLKLSWAIPSWRPPDLLRKASREICKRRQGPRAPPRPAPPSPRPSGHIMRGVALRPVAAAHRPDFAV